MAEGQETPEIPAEMDVHEAAGLLDKLAAEPEKKPTTKNKAGREIDPDTKKFVKQEKAEHEESESEAEEVEPEKEEAEEKPTEAEKRFLKLKLDGMEQDVEEEEVKRGYLRQADYTKKTQAHAEAVKKFEAEDRAAVNEEREYYRSRIQAIEEALEALAPSKEPDWEALGRELPPEEFGKRFQGWKKAQEQKQAVAAEHARLRALQEQETLRERATRLRQEQEKLELAIPDLKDPEKGKVLREDLSAYAKSLGFSDDDIGNIEDHRALVILNESRLWRESQKRRPTVEAKVEKAIAGLKPTTPAAKPKAKVTEMLRQRAKTSGTPEDAAALLDHLAGVESP